MEVEEEEEEEDKGRRRESEKRNRGKCIEVREKCGDETANELTRDFTLARGILTLLLAFHF